MLAYNVDTRQVFNFTERALTRADDESKVGFKKG